MMSLLDHHQPLWEVCQNVSIHYEKSVKTFKTNIYNNKFDITKYQCSTLATKNPKSPKCIQECTLITFCRK